MDRQKEINEAFAPLQEKWNQKVKESGKSEAMFIATDKTGFASEFLYNYAVAKEAVEQSGFIMPTLVDGLSVKIND